MRFALLGLRQPQRVLLIGSPRVFVDKPPGTLEHIIRGGGEAEAESQIITLASFSVIASSERGAHQHLLPLRRRLGNAANREHMLAGGGRRRTNTAPYTRRAEADGGHATSPAASSAATRAENRGGDDLFGI